MAETSTPISPAPITDHRPTPRGVLPRHVQTWLMVALATGMLLIILITGRPVAPERATPVAAPPQQLAPDRVRDYQDRLRAMEARAAEEAQAAQVAPAPPTNLSSDPASVPEDPIAAERRRRDYESLFASNVVLSRRPEAERPDAGRGREAAATPGAVGDPGAPSVDEIADAVVRATRRSGGVSAAGSTGAAGAPVPAATATRDAARPAQTPAISPAGPTHRVLEGTVIDTVLTNRLDGSMAAPVNCLVTNALYSHSGQQVLIPAGARVLGETKPVQSFGDTRLAVAFHRLVLPDGRTHSLDQFIGLNQIGDAGLRDRVNHHYWSTFGAAAAVGLISGLAQAIGTAGIGRGDGDRTIIIAGGATDATAQASLQVMNRFLNRLPTITIREGHRIKVYLTGDLELPAYVPPALPRTP